MRYEAVVIGGSFGAFRVLQTLLSALPANFPIPIIIVQHIGPHSNGFLVKSLNDTSKVLIKEAEDKEKLEGGAVYFAPANYHLLLEDDMSVSLSVDERVHYSRPSIDVLFESAAYALCSEAIGVILTGANKDGSNGLREIKKNGGLAIVQDPKTAEAETMPLAALESADADYVLKPEEIGPFLVKITKHSL